VPPFADAHSGRSAGQLAGIGCPKRAFERSTKLGFGCSASVQQRPWPVRRKRRHPNLACASPSPCRNADPAGQCLETIAVVCRRIGCRSGRRHPEEFAAQRQLSGTLAVTEEEAFCQVPPLVSAMHWRWGLQFSVPFGRPTQQDSESIPGGGLECCASGMIGFDLRPRDTAKRATSALQPLLSSRGCTKLNSGSPAGRLDA
jgi:hypothetical protein